MRCSDVKRMSYFFLDGSLGQQKLLEFTVHIEVCRDCDDRVSLQRRLRDFVRRRLTPMRAPDSLRIRVSQSLRVVTE